MPRTPDRRRTPKHCGAPTCLTAASGQLLVQLGIGKRGDKYIRTLLIHGARSALRTAPGKTDRLSRWVVTLAQRSHPNVAATALANKMARVARAMLRHGTNYEPERMTA